MKINFSKLAAGAFKARNSGTAAAKSATGGGVNLQLKSRLG